MIIDENTWVKYFKGFDIYDGTYGFEHGRVGLLLIEVVNDDHDEYDNPWYTPKKKLISIVINNPPEKRVFSMILNNVSLATISSGWAPSQSEFVIVSEDRQVISYKTREYKGIENRIDIFIPGSSDIKSVITKVVRVGNSAYAIGGGLRIYKRINYQNWQEYSKSIPVPDGFIEGKAEAISRNFF
ncbi:hypothetical protein AC423_004772, partial [Salmonella enterica subsp. enterica]|nr:hypothetical protein [Salmonella enterica subsp. enterica]